MRAMALERPGTPLRLTDAPEPQPTPGQALIEVRVCGVCRTDLHVVDGDLTEPKLPVIPGHQIVGTVIASAGRFRPGDRVGVPWLGWCCGECRYCLAGQENLCDRARYTGYQIDGGFAERCVADERFCFPIPEGYPDLRAAPLLCAGLIGYRCLRMAGDARVLEFALSLGAEWAGGSDEAPPEPLDAAILFAPAGELVPAGLRAVRKGGVVVCGGIHMSDIPSFPYSILWEERVVRSVANLTRRDGEEFLALAPRVPVRIEAHAYPLEKANEALDDLRRGRFTGSAVIVP